MPAHFSLNTPVEDLYKYRLARFGQTSSQRLASALKAQFGKKNSAEVTVEDLLGYLPMRYEDRSHPARIRDLTEGIEASLELEVKVAGGYQVRNRRSFSRSSLFIFEITATDPERTGRPVVVWWFVSGSHAHDIVAYYTKRFQQGARFMTFGAWTWDQRRATYSLHLNKPADELEMLSPVESDANKDEDAYDPKLAAIHVGRCVPIYRKLGDFSSKRLREIVHATLALLPDAAIPESLPAELLRRHKLINRSVALRAIHFPTDDTPLKLYEQSRSPAHLRLIFEDFFWVVLAIALKRGKRTKETKAAVIKLDRATKLR